MIEVTKALPEFEDMFLLLVFRGDVADRPLQADGGVVVVGHALGGHLAVLIDRQLLAADYTVDVVPGPAHTQVAVSLAARLAQTGSCSLATRTCTHTQVAVSLAARLAHTGSC